MLEAVVGNIPLVTEFVEKQLRQYKCPVKALRQINIAIDEIFGNIAQYAYQPETGPVTIRLEVVEEPLSAIITFKDKGIPFDPLQTAEPDISLSAEERQSGGLGIYLVKKSMDEVVYAYRNGKNILKLKKNL